MPESYRAQNRILKVEIKGQEPEEKAGRLNVRYLGQGGVFYMIEYFDGASGGLRNVSVQSLTSHGIARRIDAQHAKMRDGLWSFEDGFLRTFRDSTRDERPLQRIRDIRASRDPRRLRAARRETRSR